jgi:hypothetical protein
MKPNANTPVDVIILTLHALAAWVEQHKGALDLYLPEDMDEADEVRAGARTLELASDDYTRELREDVAQTSARRAAIEQAQKVVRAVFSIGRAQLEKAGLHDRAAKDLGTVRPSKLTYVPSARKALRVARQGVVAHSAALDSDGKVRSAHLLKRIDEACALLDTVAEDSVREDQETRTARRAFELAHERALDIIDALHTAAEAAQLDDDAPMEALVALYDAANHRAAPRATPADPASI